MASIPLIADPQHEEGVQSSKQEPYCQHALLRLPAFLGWDTEVGPKALRIKADNEDAAPTYLTES